VLLHRFVLGPIETNCYLIACEETGEAMIIDPYVNEDEIKGVLDLIHELGYRVRYILNTHGHGDHAGGNKLMKEALNAQILIHEADVDMILKPWDIPRRMLEAGTWPNCPSCNNKVQIEIDEEQEKGVLRCMDCGFDFPFYASPFPDRILWDGDLVKVGNLLFEVLHTPGHSPGGISLYSRDEEALFSGDTLLNGGIGHSSIIGGSREDLVKSVKRLLKLPGETKVYPGHGENTTISQEQDLDFY